MYRYRTIKNQRLAQYLAEHNFIPIFTNPVPHTWDTWKYTYNNSKELLDEIDNFYRTQKELRKWDI